jgi:imidazolonepropionase-like amidohydrolase
MRRTVSLPSSIPPAALLAAALAACTTTAPPKPAPPTAAAPAAPRPPPFPPYELPEEPPDPPSKQAPPRPVLLRGATVMTAAWKTFEDGHVLLVGGKIASVGEGPGSAPEEALVVDARGMFVTPGIIDTHSHMGVYPIPWSTGNSDGNEATDPTTAEVWAEHAFWPHDPALPRAVAGGITTIQVLPGSANLIGGRSFTAKLKLGGSAREMRFPGAPQGVKMACGENPKRVYATRGPSTRMGNVAAFRKIFQTAADYRRRWQKYDRDLALWRERAARQSAKDAEKDKAPAAIEAKTGEAARSAPGSAEERAPLDPPEPPSRDLELETLALVLDGKILVHNHCYRADEMNIMLDLAKQFRFKIRSFHHALEAYKLRERLAAEEVATSTWADWWGFKMEAYDGIPHNAALVSEAGARAIIHSDSHSEIRHLNHEAAKALAAGRSIGIAIDENEALRWITANPAWALGIEHLTGTLTEGKMADVVVWNASPFSVYALPQLVYIDGQLVYDRSRPRPQTDFELGQPENGGGLPYAPRPEVSR